MPQRCSLAVGGSEVTSNSTVDPINSSSSEQQQEDDRSRTPNSSHPTCGSPQSQSPQTNVSNGGAKTGQVKPMSHSSPKPVAKRVAFSDNLQPPMRMQRSYSVSEGEQNGMYPPFPMNTIVQRTHSFSHGKPLPLQLPAAYSTNAARGPPPPHHPIHVSLPYDHRLPRVHRSPVYETTILPGGYPNPPPTHNPLHQPPPNSAFRIVPSLPIHPADYRNQPRYSSLPLHNQKLLQGVEGGRYA